MTTQRTQSRKNTLSMLVHIMVCAVALLLITYIYFVFSTTSLIAQHRVADNDLDQLVAQRSALEYEYHMTSEELFTLPMENYELGIPDTLAYISLADGVNVAFASENE
ncbi:hypothetical protein H6776_02185 [Candidatus Nomurabacteria bacterium]|nr:hypothetical protein [Candidatus Nomurabacteria bacterium]